MATLLTPSLRARRRPTGVALARRWTQRHPPRVRSLSRALAIVLTHQAVPARLVGPLDTLVALRVALSGGRRHHPRSDLRPAGLKVPKQWRNSISRDPSLELTKLWSSIQWTDGCWGRRQTGKLDWRRDRATGGLLSRAKTRRGDVARGGWCAPFLRSASLPVELTNQEMRVDDKRK